MKPYLKIPTPRNMSKRGKTKLSSRRKRSECDFLTEIIRIPQSKKRTIIFTILFFLYCFLAPRFFGFFTHTPKEDQQLLKYRASIQNFSKMYDVPPALVAAIMKTESGFRPHVVSPRGATGLMQVLPSTARSLNIRNLHDIDQNIHAGVKYIRLLLDQFRGNVVLAVAAYNAGPGAVKKVGGVPRYKETRRYVEKVLRQYKEYKKNFS